MEDIWKGATFWSFHWKAPSRTYLVLSISWGLTIPESPEGNASEVIYPSPINGEASEIGEEEKTKRWWIMGGLAIQSGRGYGGRVWLGTNCQWASSRDQILGRKHSPDPHGTHMERTWNSHRTKKESIRKVHMELKRESQIEFEGRLACGESIWFVYIFLEGLRLTRCLMSYSIVKFDTFDSSPLYILCHFSIVHICE